MYNRRKPPLSFPVGSPVREIDRFAAAPPSVVEIDAPRRCACTSGVIPSPSETAGSFGNTSAYRHSVRGRDFKLSRVSVAAARRKSYRASRGFPHVQTCCSIDGSYFFPQAEHSNSTTLVGLVITVKV